MSVDFRLLDHLKFTDRISVNFAVDYSEDDRICIITETGLYIITLKGYVACPFPTFSCKNDFVKISNFIPNANIDLDINSFHKNLLRDDLYETVLSSEYTANLNHTTPTDIYPLCAQWSPRGIVGKTDCLLAVLTNLYSLEIYAKYLDENETVEYCVICNVTKEIINVEKLRWKNTEKFPYTAKLNEVKKRIASTLPTAFTWSHLFNINSNETCVMFVGHLNDISVWKINLRPAISKEQSKLHCLGRYSTQLRKITALYWHQTGEFEGGLCFADSDGKMSILNVTQLDQQEVSMDKEVAFLTEPDGIEVDQLTVMICGNRTYVLMVKRYILTVYGIDDVGYVFDQKVCNVGNYYITGIHHFENIILVLTITGILMQYTLSIINDKIILDEKIITLKIDITRYRTHGFFFSKNMVLFGLIAYPCQLRSFSKLKKFLNVFIFHNSILKPFEILWHNSSGSLRDYWDCFEVLRLICLKEKRFPWLGLPPDLNYDNLSLLQLKTLRWLAKLSEMIFSVVPIVKNYHIKPYILLHYLVEIKLVLKRINALLSSRDTGNYLSSFQMRSIDIQNFFLKEMVVENILAKANVGKNFISEIYHVMSIANELRYPPMMQCVWCGEKIIGPVCLPPHADSRCSISMMPIFLIPAYKCPFCKALAHEEIEKETDVIFCPYCDIPMEKRNINEDTRKDLTDCLKEKNKDFTLSCEEVTSVCFDDCLKDDINFSDVEENTCDFVIFSDSEDDLSEQPSRLQSLYVRMANMSLDEIVKSDTDMVEGASDESVEAGPSQKAIKLNDATKSVK